MTQMKDAFKQTIGLDKPIIDRKLVKVIMRRMKLSQTWRQDNESKNDGTNCNIKNP